MLSRPNPLILTQRIGPRELCSNRPDIPRKCGFVFLQLGMVEVLLVEDDWEFHSLQEGWERYWMDTKFCRAIRIAEDDAANRAYLIYNVHVPVALQGTGCQMKIARTRATPRTKRNSSLAR